MRFHPFSLTKRTFINAQGLFRARSFAHAVEKFDGYKIKVLDYFLYKNGVVLMGVNLNNRTVYFQYADTESQAYRFLRHVDRYAMPIVLTEADEWFSPDAIAHHLALVTNEQYLYWLIVSR